MRTDQSVPECSDYRTNNQVNPIQTVLKCSPNPGTLVEMPGAHENNNLKLESQDVDSAVGLGPWVQKSNQTYSRCAPYTSSDSCLHEHGHQNLLWNVKVHIWGHGPYLPAGWQAMSTESCAKLYLHKATFKTHVPGKTHEQLGIMGSSPSSPVTGTARKLPESGVSDMLPAHLALAALAAEAHFDLGGLAELDTLDDELRLSKHGADAGRAAHARVGRSDDGRYV